MASHSRVCVNQNACDAFVIKLNIGRLNCHSARVRMKYWSHFGADEKMKQRQEPELEKTHKNNGIPSAQVRVIRLVCVGPVGVQSGRSPWVNLR